LAEATNALGTSDEVFSALDNVDINLGYIKDEEKTKVLLTNSNYIKYLNSKNKDVRKDAFKKMYEYFKNHNYTLAASYNGLLKETKFLTKVRKYNNPVEHSLYSDNIEYEFYEKFINNISKYLDLNHKYMRIRNNALGYKQHMYDVYVEFG
jgi:Oligoendopeptidase F